MSTGDRVAAPTYQLLSVLVADFSRLGQRLQSAIVVVNPLLEHIGGLLGALLDCLCLITRQGRNGDTAQEVFDTLDTICVAGNELTGFLNTECVRPRSHTRGEELRVEHTYRFDNGFDAFLSIVSILPKL